MARSHGESAPRTVTAPARETRTARSALVVRTTVPGSDTSCNGGNLEIIGGLLPDPEYGEGEGEDEQVPAEAVNIGQLQRF